MHLPRGQMVHHQPEGAVRANATVGRSQGPERGKKAHTESLNVRHHHQVASSLQCLNVQLVCAKEFNKELSTGFGTKLTRAKYRACNGAEPDRGADSGQEPVQETKCGDQ